MKVIIENENKQTMIWTHGHTIKSIGEMHWNLNKTMRRREGMTSETSEELIYWN